MPKKTEKFFGIIAGKIKIDPLSKGFIFNNRLYLPKIDKQKENLTELIAKYLQLKIINYYENNN